jgi:hypothetical protein
MDTFFITPQILGGVGNQLFQIAAAYALAKETNKKLVLQKNKKFPRTQGNEYSYYFENLYKKIEVVDEVKNDITILYEDNYNIDLLNDTKNVLTEGYFQSDKYFHKYENDIKNLFTPNEGIVQFLEKNTNVFQTFPELKYLSEDRVYIGVRRGDYIKASYAHNPCGMDYYSKALSIYSDKHRTYYINSDDIAWCKEKFIDNELCSFKFISMQKDYETFYLGTLFKNYIISNSTFHWWVSYLSVFKNIYVVAPDQWINAPNYEKIYRKDMHILNRHIET